MSNDNTGGPAFPHGPLGDSMTFDDGRTNHQVDAHPGMSLRDWFAGQALSGLLDAGDVNSTDSFHFKVTRDAYRIADAMLKARKDGQ